MSKRRHKKNRPSSVVRIGEVVTPERRRHQGGVITEVVDRDSNGRAYIKRQRARVECMLDYYFNEYRITEPQYMAGMKFKEYYNLVNYGHSSSFLKEPFVMRGGHSDAEGKAIAHMDNFKKLEEVYALLTEAQRRIVLKVCGHDEYAGNKDNKETLLRALDRMAKFWNYI